MKAATTSSLISWVALCVSAAAAEPVGSSQDEFAYRMQVSAPADAAAYRLTLPLALYQKVAHPDLSDIRVFNAAGEQVPFAIEHPVTATLANAAAPLALFPLKDDSRATLDALRVTIESGRNAINVQTSGQVPPSGQVATYLVDGRALEVPVAALRLDWPEDASDFAGRMRVEASDSLADWQVVATAAPVANLHANAGRLVEQRVELIPTKARYWRLSWVGAAAPFALTAVSAEPAKQNVAARHVSQTVPATESPQAPGEFIYAAHARAPVDRVNLELPDANSVVEVELLSRTRMVDSWRAVRSCGFYRLRSEGGELRNGPVPLPVNTDAHWLVRTDPKRGGLGKVSPRLVLEWVPHELVFVARGAAPFYVAYGSFTVDTAAAVSLDLLPKNLSIVRASLSNPEPLGGDDLLRSPPPPYAWKTAFLWIVLIGGAGLLAWMALRLSKDVKRT
jgi:hypothetical protein